MAKVYCVILDSDQMPAAKAVLTDIRGTDAYLELIKGSYTPEDYEGRQTVQLRVMNTDNDAETYRGRIRTRDGDTLELAHFELLSQREKRDDVKVLLNKPMLIICTGKDGRLRKSTAKLRDLSAGGVCVITDEDIPVGGTFEVVYDLSRRPDLLKVEVIRRTELEEGGYSYGCRFLDLHFTQEHTVREYVFKRHLGLIGRSWRT